MDALLQARAEINQIDAEMATLFERRMKAVATVAEYKLAHGLPVLDASREQCVIERNSSLVRDADLRPYYETFIKYVMEVSKLLQRRMIADKEDCRKQ